MCWLLAQEEVCGCGTGGPYSLRLRIIKGMGRALGTGPPSICPALAFCPWAGKYAQLACTEPQGSCQQLNVHAGLCREAPSKRQVLMSHWPVPRIMMIRPCCTFDFLNAYMCCEACLMRVSRARELVPSPGTDMLSREEVSQ